MSSSTMMNAPTMSQASHARTAKEARTRPASQAHGGTRRTALAKLDLGEAARDLPCLGGLRLDADVGRGLTHLPQHRVGDRGSARRLLERRRVQLCNMVDVVLAARERGCFAPHLLTDVRPCQQELECRRQRPDLSVVHRHLERDRVRKLREPADVAYDERLPEREG